MSRRIILRVLFTLVISSQLYPQSSAELLYEEEQIKDNDRYAAYKNLQDLYIK